MAFNFSWNSCLNTYIFFWCCNFHILHINTLFNFFNNPYVHVEQIFHFSYQIKQNHHWQWYKFVIYLTHLQRSFPNNLATGKSLRSLAYGFQISHCITKQTVWELLQLVCEMKIPLYLPSSSEHDLTRNSWVLGKLAFPQLCGSNRGRKHVHTLCVRSVVPPFSYTRIASWLIDWFLKHILIVTHICSCERSELTAESFQNLQWEKRPTSKILVYQNVQTAKFWKFLPHVIIGNNVCVHVSSTDCMKKSQHKDSKINMPKLQHISNIWEGH